MADVIGRNVRVEVGLTEGTPVTVTALTLANPAVASATSHGYANGDVVFLSSIVGTEELEGQASRASAVAAGTFAMENVSSVGMGTWTSGTATKIATWGTLAKAQKVTVGRGSRTRLQATVLLDRVGREILGAAGAVSVDIDGLSDLRSAAMQKVIDAAVAGTTLTFRISAPGGTEVRVFRAQVDMPGEEWNTDALTTSGFGGTMVGRYVAFGT